MAFYRLLTLEVLSKSINKILYFDSDTIINLDIKEMWTIDIGNHPLAVVPSVANGMNLLANSWNGFDICREGLVKHEDYFNSGVLIMNLKRLRNETDTLKRGFEFYSKRKDDGMDQIILNYCFAAQALKLPAKYNWLLHTNRSVNEPKDAIYHYAGRILKLDMKDNFNRLWMKYFIKTPWFNEDTIGNLYEGIRQIYIERQHFATQVSAMMSGKTRAFFVSEQYLEVAKQIFEISDSEEIIVANSADSIKKLGISIIESHRKNLFFILIDNFYSVYQILTKAGFTINKDFLNATIFLSDIHGVPLNSYPLVKIL